MAWLGLITGIIIYWCFFTMVVTGRFSWILLCVWCIPVMGMCLFYHQDMKINGLMVILCFSMFSISRKSLTDVRMWNLKMRKQHSFIFGVIYLFCLLFLAYSVWQAQNEGYLWDFQGIFKQNNYYIRLVLTALPVSAVAIPLSEMVYNSLDRLRCKENELVLLACKFFTASCHGGERGLWKGYYLDAIHNGVNYHFKMTRRTYAMLKKEKNLRLHVKVGLFGGLYVLENPCPDHVKKVRKSDRRNAKMGILCFLVVFSAGIWYFWFGI